MYTHTDQVRSNMKTAYKKLLNLIQESQRAYVDCKRAEDHGTREDYMRASDHYHEVQALIERGLREVIGLTEVDLDPLGARPDAVGRKTY